MGPTQVPQRAPWVPQGAPLGPWGAQGSLRCANLIFSNLDPIFGAPTPDRRLEGVSPTGKSFCFTLCVRARGGGWMGFEYCCHFVILHGSLCSAGA